jgi:hypothetical protein
VAPFLARLAFWAGTQIWIMCICLNGYRALPAVHRDLKARARRVPGERRRADHELPAVAGDQFRMLARRQETLTNTAAVRIC